jgi:pyruvate formate lyase activating enzyme
MREAMYWEKTDGAIKCLLCPHSCEIAGGSVGHCLARRNADGELIAESYGQVTALALDPIEKKPLRRFEPGSMILSIGGYGCNLRCPFCQNHHISMQQAESRYISPAELAKSSAETAGNGNIGVAYTYNEPLIGYEYVLDCAKLIRAQGQKNVLVTNGTINPEPLAELLPLIDAMNIDLKCFSEEGYRRLGGCFKTTKNTVSMAAESCHVEVTTLIVPGVSDDEAEMDALAAWLASTDVNIPLHVGRYIPRHKYTQPATGAAAVYRLADIARRYLRYVYTGNL